MGKWMNILDSPRKMDEQHLSNPEFNPFACFHTHCRSILSIYEPCINISVSSVRCILIIWPYEIPGAVHHRCVLWKINVRNDCIFGNTIMINETFRIRSAYGVQSLNKIWVPSYWCTNLQVPPFQHHLQWSKHLNVDDNEFPMHIKPSKSVNSFKFENTVKMMQSWSISNGEDTS